MKPYRILALSGSLRSNSYNSAVNQALQPLAPAHIQIVLFERMADIPLFNPDLASAMPDVIYHLKAEVDAADGLIISSPEYAHGISGVMKNALDWLVSGEEFIDKPVLLINTSPRAIHAQAALKEVLQTMSGIVLEPSLEIPLLGSGLDTSGIINHAEFSNMLTQALTQFCTCMDRLNINKN